MKLEKDTKDETRTVIRDKVLKAKGLTNFVTGKGARRIATVFLYEKIGNTEKFAGTYPLLKGTFPIGEYCVLDYKKPVFVDVPNAADYIPASDKKIDKIIEMVKYSEDDFRVKSRLNEEFFKEIQRPIFIEKEVVDENGDRLVDEDGEPILVKVQATDDKGNPKFNTIKEHYTEPRGVLQEGRDAIRSGNEYKQKIKEFKERNKGFFEKYGQMIVPVVVIAVAALMFMFSLKFSHDNLQAVALDFKDTAEASKTWWNDKDFLDKVVDASQKKDDEQNAPPIK